jgi:hypothetical protein
MAALEVSGTQEIRKTEIHNIEFHTHHKNVEIPVLDIAKIQDGIRTLILEVFQDIIKKGDVLEMLKGIIKDATKELVIEKAKFKEVDITSLFEVAIKNITKDKEIIRYKEKEQEFIIPKIKFVPRDIIDPVMVPTNVIDVKLIPKDVISPVLVPTKIIDPVLIKKEISDPFYTKKEVIDPVLREKIIWVDRVMEGRP